MTRVLRGCQAAVAVFLLGAGAPAHAGDLMWQFSQDNESAFLGVVDSAKAGEGNYLFYMSCAGTSSRSSSMVHMPSLITCRIATSSWASEMRPPAT